QACQGRRERAEGSAQTCVTRRRATEDTGRRRFAGSWSDLAEDADYLAEHSGFGRDDRLHFLVLGLEADVVGFAEVALDGRLLADRGDDDPPFGRVAGRPHDHVVGFDDPGFLHRFAADLEDVVAALPADHVGYFEVFLDVLFGEDRGTGGDR